MIMTQVLKISFGGLLLEPTLAFDEFRAFQKPCTGALIKGKSVVLVEEKKLASAG